MPVTFEHVEHTYKKYVEQLAPDKWSKETCAVCQEGAKKKHYLLHTQIVSECCECRRVPVQNAFTQRAHAPILCACHAIT